MKKFFKISGIIIASIIILVAVALLYINYKGIPYYTVEKIDYTAISTAESVERGRKLVTFLCANCHLNRETGKLTGKRMVDAPPEFGVIYSKNITQDKTYGIGDWTDGELLYLLRTGIKKNGEYAPPYMAKLPHMADEDMNAIISFLRSDNRMVTADPNPDIESSPSLLTKILCRVAFKPLPMPTGKIEMPDSTNAVESGRYLAYNLECFSCHSADFKTNDFLDPSLSKGFFGGGNKPLDLEGRVKLTPNLTPDKETGIGTWTKNDFVQAVKYGRVKGQKALTYPMIPYTGLTDKEAGDIYEYLRTIPPIKHKVIRSIYN